MENISIKMWKSTKLIGSTKVEYDNTNDINIISMTITMNQNNNNKTNKNIFKH